MTMPNGIVRRGLALAALFILGLDAAVPAASAADAATVGAVVVRFRGDAVPHDASALPPAFADELAQALRVGVVDRGRTRDGAFRLSLEPPLPFVEARDAITRVRLRDDILYASLAPARDAAALPRVQPKSGTPEPLLHRLIVKYRDPGLEQSASLNLPLGQNQLDRIAALAGQPVAHERVMSGDAYVVRLFNRVSREEVEAIADVLAQDPSVEWAQPDYLDQIALAPNDPSYASQWHYFEAAGGVNLPAAWNRTTGSASVRVAVIDTGSLPNHPDLSGKFVGGYDMISAFPIPGNDGNGRDADPSDPGDWVAAGECSTGSSARNSSWHGTHVAGTIAALTNNGVGVAGVNWASPVVPVRVLGKCGGYSSDIADGMTWASGGTVSGVPPNGHPAQVLNLSLGGYRSNAACDAVYQTAISGALSRNVVVVVAAGNSNQETKYHTPANCNGVITVAATGRSGQRASYSNYDDNETGVQVEIAAPGGSDGAGVLSTLNNSTTSPNPSGYNYVNYNGTSMATPHVAGVVSLMLSVAPTTTPSQILAAITSTARPFPVGTIRDCTSNLAAVTSSIKYCGAGIIDADAAIAAVSSLPATTTTLASSANPSTYGQSVTFTAAVTGTSPTGNVAFTAGGATIAGCAAVALTGAGNTRTAQCATAALATGARSIVATYAGNAGNAGSTSAPLSQTVNKATSTTGLASSSNPSAVGASVTFTATVTGTTPTGTVAFTDNGVAVSGCTAVALTGAGNIRTAQCPTTALPVGSRSIVATYAGDTNNTGSTSSTLAQTVNKAVSTTGIASSANPSVVGASVTFTATIVGVAPTGTVSFTVDGATISGCGAVALAGAGNIRTGQCPTSALTAGLRSIVATYGGDASNNGSASSTLSQTVTAAPGITTTTLASSENPSIVGSAVTFTATVTGASPTGTVAFTDGGATIAGCGGVALVAGKAACMAAALAAGSHPIVATYGGDGANAGSASGPLTQLVVPPVLAKQRDFDGTLTADLLWRNNAGGHAIWLMNGTNIGATANLGIDPPRAVAHAADFDGNGRHDLLLRNASDGATTMQLMNGLAPAGSATLLVDPSWEVTHTGDFDGDGNADLVWRNEASGTTSMWRMNGTTFVAGATLLVNAAWRVTHVADFDGNGRADLAWRNDTTGETAIWLMNGTTFVSGAVVLANTGWSIALTGDFDGNGTTDLVWRNASTGQVALWLMNGLTRSSGAIVLADPVWVPTHAADFTGDGRADLVWRNTTTGATSLWLMNGLAMTGGGSVTNAGSTVAAVGDYNADGRADLVWHNASTGVTEMWLMDRLAPLSTATLLVSTWWSVRP